MGRIRRQRGAARGGRGDRHPAGRPRQSAVDPGVRHPAGVRQGVRAGDHAQSRARFLPEAAAARAGDLERLGACAFQMGVGCGGRRNGVLEHQPRGHRNAAHGWSRAVSTVVVYVHGLWVTGGEAFWLRRRLEQDLAARTLAFPYPSVTADITANARALAEFLSPIRANTLHLVGHSLGGLVILKLFEETADTPARLPPGRIVLLGSPMRGSRSARNFARLPFGKKIMGLGATGELMGLRERRWDGARDLGLIAGDLGIGLGRLAGAPGGARGGTLLVSQTDVGGAAGLRGLKRGSAGLLFS